MSDNVIPINDDITLEAPFKDVAEKSKDIIETGIVVGWTKEGNMYLAASMESGPEMNWLLDKAKQLLMDITS